MLKIRILYGQVSFQDKDAHFRQETWPIHQYIVENLEKDYRSTPCGELISFFHFFFMDKAFCEVARQE